jgi:hypothetical protein
MRHFFNPNDPSIPLSLSLSLSLSNRTKLNSWRACSWDGAPGSRRTGGEGGGGGRAEGVANLTRVLYAKFRILIINIWIVINNRDPNIYI